MDIYVHNRLCSAEEVEDIQISRIHKIHILRYQEAADEKHRLKRSDWVHIQVIGGVGAMQITDSGGRWERVALTTDLLISHSEKIILKCS